MTDPEALAEWLDSVSSDPVRFVEEGFSWGQGELTGMSGPEPWQRWLLETIRDGLLTPGEAIKIAIASGHGIGKSCLCAWVTLWSVSTFPDTRAVVTASSESMLMTRFRAELRTWYRRFRAAEFFELTATSLISRMRPISKHGAAICCLGIPTDLKRSRACITKAVAFW